MLPLEALPLFFGELRELLAGLLDALGLDHQRHQVGVREVAVVVRVLLEPQHPGAPAAGS